MSGIEQGDARDFLVDLRADLILTDPPHLDTYGDGDDVDLEHEAFTDSWLPKAIRAVGSAGTVYLTCGADPRELASYIGCAMPDEIRVWTHPAFKPGKSTRNVPAHHLHLIYRGHHAPDLLQMGTSVLHASKPMPLYSWIIEQYVPEGALVVDPFCGRGEIPKAARDMNRQYLGCEILKESVEACWEQGL